MWERIHCHLPQTLSLTEKLPELEAMVVWLFLWLALPAAAQAISFTRSRVLHWAFLLSVNPQRYLLDGSRAAVLIAGGQRNTAVTYDRQQKYTTGMHRSHAEIARPSGRCRREVVGQRTKQSTSQPS